MRGKITRLAVMLIVCGLSGCGTMMVLLGDNIRYSISGKVYSLSDVQASAMAVDAAGIPDVTVEVSCPGIENSIYQNRRGVTDQNGYYQLTGYWQLEGCEVTFKHHNYKPVRIAIDRSHLINSTYLSRTYQLNARLEPDIGAHQYK